MFSPFTFIFTSDIFSLFYYLILFSQESPLLCEDFLLQSPTFLHSHKSVPKFTTFCKYSSYESRRQCSDHLSSLCSLFHSFIQPLIICTCLPALDPFKNVLTNILLSLWGGAVQVSTLSSCQATDITMIFQQCKLTNCNCEK